MRLQRLDLLRFGHFTDHSFELPRADCDFHLIFGPNEAGKSTALAAIEDLLFGIPAQSPYNFRHKYADMRIGALLENAAANLELMRRKGSKDTLLGADGFPLSGGESVLRPFLAGADRAFFERMFSLDHTRLEAGGRDILQARDEIGQILFAAGTGISGLRARLERLNREADELWGARKAKRRQFSQAEEKLREAQKTLRERTFSASKWQELKRDHESAEAEYEAIRTRITRLSAELAQLIRVRRVCRPISRKAMLDQQIAALGEVAPLPEDAAAILSQAERREAEAAARIETLKAQVQQAEQALHALQFDSSLLSCAEDIEQLAERRIEIRKEKAELPACQAELDTAQSALLSGGRELGWQDDAVPALIDRLPARSKASAVNTLLGRRGGLAADVRSRAQALQEAEAELERLREAITAGGAALELDRLAAVIRAVREAGDPAGALRQAEHALNLAGEKIRLLFDSLQPPLADEQQAASLAVPARAEVEGHRDQVQDWQRRCRETRLSINTVSDALQAARQSYQRTSCEEQAISQSQLQAAREHRNSLWNLIRHAHIDHTPIPAEQSRRFARELKNLAAAFEPALLQADNLADRRFDNAEAAGMLAQMALDISEHEAQLERLREQQALQQQQGQTLDESWQTLWRHAPFKPLSAEAMLEWLSLRDNLLNALQSAAEAAAAVASFRRQTEDCRGSLLRELAALPVPAGQMADDPLPLVLQQAEAFHRQQEIQNQGRRALERERQEAQGAVTRRRRELAGAEQAWHDWDAQWNTALSDLGLTPGLAAEAVSVQLELIEQMRAQAARIDELRHQRIDRMEHNIGEFEAGAGRLAKEVAAELGENAPEDIVLALQNRLNQARRQQQLQAHQHSELDKLQREVARLEENRRQAHSAITQLMQIAGSASAQALREAIDKSDALRARRQDLAETLQTLEQDGDGFAVAQLEQECAAFEIDQIAAREIQLSAELQELEEHKAQAAETRSAAGNAFQAIGGDDSSAQAEALRQEALTDMRTVAERYTRVRSSALLLQWAIDRYRQEKQAPLLTRARELFVNLTAGSFIDLQVDYDSQDQAQLTGVREGGERVPVTGMSTGTADQLYLALRVAALEDYLTRTQALPFVADDLFINFDDGRARTGLRMLAALARRTQVLFFTHHQHLVDLAQATLGKSVSVIRLDESAAKLQTQQEQSSLRLNPDL